MERRLDILEPLFENGVIIAKANVLAIKNVGNSMVFINNRWSLQPGEPLSISCSHCDDYLNQTIIVTFVPLEEQNENRLNIMIIK